MNDLTKRLEDTCRNWTGEEWTPDTALRNFRIRGPAQRAAALDQFDEAFREIEPSNNETALRKISELSELRAQLDLEHRAMLRNNR